LENLNQIFKKLNLTKEKGLYITNELLWKRMFSNRVERILIEVVKPDAFFCIDNKPFILFFENPSQIKKKLKEIWNFNEAPIVIIAYHEKLEIYNGFEYIRSQDSLKYFGNEDKLNDFSYFELVTGNTWQKYYTDFAHTNRIDYHLLENIKATREALISVSFTKELANSLLGKVIFVRYLIDRNVSFDFEQQGNSRKWSNSEFCQLLKNKELTKQFFKYLEDKFKEDVFPINDNEFNLINDESLKVIIKLLSGEEISTGQLSLFDLYDFSIIPVEFISNVYELFIGHNQQAKEGAYYTPLFLVDYILTETVDKKFQLDKNSNSCKVLDPACGSGIFLVETLRKIIEQYQLNNPDFQYGSREYKQTLKKLASDNIFGIDKDKSAINVAIFSIYLTLLDYQNPSDIESFEFPLLSEENFFVEDFFNIEASFNKKLKNKNLDFILGNPPWKRGRGDSKNPLFKTYIDNRRRKELSKSLINLEISNNEIAQAFVLRVSDFSSKNTKIGFIVTSKLLYNLNGINFRQYFLDRYSIQKVFELSPVRKEVFNNSNDKAIAPATVLFYKYIGDKLNTDKNIIEHITLKPSRFFSLFKVFTITRNDFKKISQKQLKEYDYLWKVLVYGNYLDFNLVKRLKSDYPSISDKINDEKEFIFGQGIQIGGGNKNDVTKHLKKKFIDARSDIDSFWINTNTKNKWSSETAHRPRVDSLFKAPLILISKGFKNTFRCVSAYSNEDVVFTDALTSIKAIDNSKIDILKTIVGILNSSIFSYVNLLTFSSSGIEREQAHNREKFQIPYVYDSEISNYVHKISDLKTKLLSPEIIFEDKKLKKEIDIQIKKLDNIVISAFSFSELEKTLIDYSTNITIPIIMKHNQYELLYKSIPFKGKILYDFANLFLHKFKNMYIEFNQKMSVEIRHSNQIVGMFFKLTPIQANLNDISWNSIDNDNLLAKIHSLGIQKVTDKLFIQKDIRGFERDGFYIIKPNEYSLWHKAIAYLDLNEFADAIITSGRKNSEYVQ
tara:strand:+ start:11593 stop:14625 length:3033 start_codon:yes stop_codon:yes gene_type:complete